MAIQELKKQWDTWNLRTSIILSLVLQFILISFASCRKRRGSRWIITAIWMAYLLADWIAAVAVGIISSKQWRDCDSAGNTDLLALWVAFLLLHLGGPDTITAFSLEDNEFWIRHLLSLMLHVLAAVFIFFQTLPKRSLWIPTILVFIAGTIRYVERVYAMYLSSMDNFVDSALTGHEGVLDDRLVTSFSMHTLASRADSLPADEERPQLASEDLDSKSVLQLSFGFFQIFKGMVGGILLGAHERNQSRHFFLRRSSSDALSIIKIELSLLYEVFHTKVAVVRSKAGYTFRFTNFCCLLGASVSFIMVGKGRYDEYDVWLTYVLLVGAVVSDIASFVWLIFSDWRVVAQVGTKIAQSHLVNHIDSSIIKRRRWSESVGQCSLMSYCRHDRLRFLSKLSECLHLQNVTETVKIMLSTSHKKFEKRVWDFIFEELRSKAKDAETIEEGKRKCLTIGDKILADTFVKWSVNQVEYVDSLFIWHTATEICHHILDPAEQEKEKMKICKYLSDYAFYLLVAQPTMMATVLGNWKIIFRETCEDIKKGLKNKSTHEACRSLLPTAVCITQVPVKRDGNQSSLFYASWLANQLIKSTNGNPWDLMGRVWVELLSYAAINCRPYVHAQQPSQGGELLTFMWLLMNHLGLGTQFRDANLVTFSP